MAQIVDSFERAREVANQAGEYIVAVHIPARHGSGKYCILLDP